MAKNWQKRLLRLFTRLLLALALLFVVGYLLLVYRPTAYQPRPLTESQSLAAEEFAQKLSQDLYNNSYLPEPFVLTLDDRMVNDILRLRDDDPLWRRIMRPTQTPLQRPQVSFADNTLYVMGQAAPANVPLIFTVALQVSPSDNDQLRLQLKGIKAGALPLPKSILRRQLPHVRRRLANARRQAALDNDTNDHKTLATDVLVKFLPAVAELLDVGWTNIPATFKATPDGTLVKVTDIQVANGKMLIEITPVTN